MIGFVVVVVEACICCEIGFSVYLYPLVFRTRMWFVYNT